MRDSGLKVDTGCGKRDAGCGMPKTTIGITGLQEKLGEDNGI